MRTTRRTPWSFLGSSLWLRTARAGDRRRVQALLAREDVVRTGDGLWADPFRGSGGGRKTAGRRRLIAVDLFGEVRALFLLAPGSGAGFLRLEFAAPRDEGAVLRESLRLLEDGVRRNSSASRLEIPALGFASALECALEGCGFRREGRKWGRDLRPVPPTAHRRGDP